ncbi:MAG TPA: hypothetical protein VK797_03135 [Tepidisphaeraceae bacterium]|jgi:outer membrane murein-binding lipoprotein Lpp|nr:hypothetical protein [Tepidisphaeraceae bacterium]
MKNRAKKNKARSGEQLRLLAKIDKLEAEVKQFLAGKRWTQLAAVGNPRRDPELRLLSAKTHKLEAEVKQFVAAKRAGPRRGRK